MGVGVEFREMGDREGVSHSPMRMGSEEGSAPSRKKNDFLASRNAYFGAFRALLSAKLLWFSIDDKVQF